MAREYISKIVLELQPRFDQFFFVLIKINLEIDHIDVVVVYLEFVKINLLMKNYLIKMILYNVFVKNLINRFSSKDNM
jgi:hypothetical protein